MFACLYLPRPVNARIGSVEGMRAAAASPKRRARRRERRGDCPTRSPRGPRPDRARFFAARRDAWGPHGHARHQRTRQPHRRAAIDWRRAAPHGGRCGIVRAHRCGLDVDHRHPARARARRIDGGAARRRSDDIGAVAARFTRSSLRLRSWRTARTADKPQPSHPTHLSHPSHPLHLLHPLHPN